MANIGDRIFVVLDGRVIVPAEVKKVYPNSETVWWEATSYSSDGKWRTCSYRTANHFLNLADAKERIMVAIAKERDELLAKYNAQIEQVKQFDVEHCEIYSCGSKE